MQSFYKRKVISTYFERNKNQDYKLEAKAILIDMEPKVV